MKTRISSGKIGFYGFLAVFILIANPAIARQYPLPGLLNNPGDDEEDHIFGDLVHSPSGHLAAHLGRRGDGLYVLNLATGEDKRIVHGEIGTTFRNLAFSPNGQRLMYIDIGGGTWYYPHDVFTIHPDGSGLVQLSEALPQQDITKDDRLDDTYYDVDTAEYSPDGTKILVGLIHKNGNSVAILFTGQGKADSRKACRRRAAFLER